SRSTLPRQGRQDGSELRARGRSPERGVRSRPVSAERFDIVIIGSGAGGGTMARALAETGAQILLVERGDFVPQEAENSDPGAVWKALRYRATDRWVDQDGQSFVPYTHYCVGGNTKF